MFTLAASLALLSCSAQLPQVSSDLKLDDLFPRKSFWGKPARGLAWSHDARYLAYLWSPYDDKGFDLWLYDARDGKSKRMTSIELMKGYDRDVPKAIERYKKEKEEDDKVDKMTDVERREWELKKKKEDEDRKEPLPSYEGIGEVEWAHKSHEMLLTFKGDVFRWKVGEAKPTRITRTRDSESSLEYTPNDDGFTFRRGDGVYRVRFDSPVVEQLNPPLPNNMSLGAYRLSPDGTKLMITASRSTGQDRQVDWIVYRGRFAEARKTTRGVSEDTFKTERYLFLYDVSDDAMENPRGDGKPWEVWKWSGGEEWWEAGFGAEPWSKDSRQFAFATWKRDKKDLEIFVADLAAKRTRVVYKGTSNGDHGSPGMADPMFTPDGRKLVCLLDKSGFRHAWSIDLISATLTQITKGDFETYPLMITPDGKELLVRSAKEDPARMQVYRVGLESGEFRRVTSRDGQYGNPAISEDCTKMAMSFASWSSPSELYVREGFPGGDDRRITESHRYDDWNKVHKVQPKLFTYKNRHGHTIHGFAFLPPGLSDSASKRPLFIYVYGGPLGTGYSVVDGSFNSTAYLFNMYLTYALGYITVCIDPRGQSGYGAEFGKANWEQVGKPQTEDLVDLVKHMSANYPVDPKKVGLTGWSFGGFQTQMCMYSEPDVFTLGIAGAGPTEWQNYNTWYTGGVIFNTPNGKPDDMDKFSLTHIAKNLKHPLLLLHGVEDTNVLFQDTVHVYQKLLQYGKGPIVELSIDPTGGHGMGGDMSNRDRHAIYLAFILKWWGKPG